MVEIPKKIGKIMNNDPIGNQYINTGVHKRHYWMAEDKKAFAIYNRIVKDLKERNNG